MVLALVLHCVHRDRALVECRRAWRVEIRGSRGEYCYCYCCCSSGHGSDDGDGDGGARVSMWYRSTDRYSMCRNGSWMSMWMWSSWRRMELTLATT